MNTRQLAYKIHEVYSLLDNQDLTNEQRLSIVEDIIFNVYTKVHEHGIRVGIKQCQEALAKIEKLNK